jgi:hypothetical protein
MKDYYKIIVFDDGNQKYKTLENKWNIIGSPYPEKVRIQNIDMITIIESISKWKVMQI